jgi:uncharacterized repeat protein (TIGR03803 family)
MAKSLTTVSVAVGVLSFVVSAAQAQTFSVLHTFTNKGDGGYPYSGLLSDNTGTFYGATEGGGRYSYGTIFKMDPNGKDKVLHSFWGMDGVGPHSDLTSDKSGNLYGTTQDGGTPEGGGCFHGCGTVFKLARNGELTVMYVFTGGADGGEPQAPLLLDNFGNLYGTTTIGGDLNCRDGLGCGVIFKLDSKGKQTVLHAFSGTPDGWYPSGGLFPAKNGSFYGVTWFGGTSDYGTIYKMNAAGKVAILYSFQGGHQGEYPNSPIVRDIQGNFYGTTTNGGTKDYGTVFKVSKAGKLKVLHSFKGGPDGYYPYTGLTRDNGGNLYGVTIWGGGTGCNTLGCGTIFKVDTSGNESVLYAFTGTTDGSEPEGTLVLDEAGDLYGTAPAGGDPRCRFGGCGTVFKLAP